MIAPPPLRQESDDSCAIACLRMLLAAHGRTISERTLEKRGKKQVGGVDIEDLRDLAETFGFQARIERLDLEAIAGRIREAIFPIVYLNRAHLGRALSAGKRAVLRSPIVHAVVPVRVSPAHVAFNDPLTGTRRRVTRRRFAAAQADLGNWCVVCSRVESR
jgi:ABC-type bacteriocin/lantibiotic exporter with double-glycine peptidase domain